MKYRHMAPEKERDLLERTVLAAERTAFEAECNVKRLEAIRPLKAERQRHAELLTEAREQAGVARASAQRFRRDAPVTNEQIRNTRREVLEHWVKTIEEQHRRTKQHLDARAPDDDGSTHRKVLRRLETTHAVALAELAALRVPATRPKRPARKAPAAPARKAAAKKPASRRRPRNRAAK